MLAFLSDLPRVEWAKDFDFHERVSLSPANHSAGKTRKERKSTKEAKKALRGPGPGAGDVRGKSKGPQAGSSCLQPPRLRPHAATETTGASPLKKEWASLSIGLDTITHTND